MKKRLDVAGTALVLLGLVALNVSIGVLAGLWWAVLMAGGACVALGLLMCRASAWTREDSSPTAARSPLPKGEGSSPTAARSPLPKGEGYGRNGAETGGGTSGTPSPAKGK